MSNIEEQTLSADDVSEWEQTDNESDSERDSDYEDEAPIEDVIYEGGEVHATGSTMKRKREYDSASDSEDENGNVPGLVVDDDEEIAEDNDGAAALNTSNVVRRVRRRLDTERFVAEPVATERSDKWNSFIEMAGELRDMNARKPTRALCGRYKVMLKDALAETPSPVLSAATGWLTAVKAMPAHRKLTKWKGKLMVHLHKEWAEEAKRVHFKKMVKIAQLTSM
jgi:hypothetical protein